MVTKKMSSIAIKFAVVIALTIPTTIYATTTVIDFQSLEHVDKNLVDHGSTYLEDGFEIRNIGIGAVGLSTFGTLDDRYPGSTAMFNNEKNAFTTLTRIGGGTFNPTSIDLGELSFFGASVVFTRDGGHSQTFNLDAIFGMETFTFNFGFAESTWVKWRGNLGHQFDNINMSSISPVPELNMSTMMLIGVASLLGFRRFQRRR